MYNNLGYLEKGDFFCSFSSSKHIYHRYQFLAEQTPSCCAPTMSFETYSHKALRTQYV